MQIVSLLPSATEILFDLGLGDQVVGVTFECDFPPEAKTRRIVSTSALPSDLTPGEIDAVVKERIAAGEDLYRLDRGALADLDPDLIITQDLCAVCAVDVTEVDDALEFLMCSAEVVTLDPMTLFEVIESINTVGAATDTEANAAAIIAGLNARLNMTSSKLIGVRRPRTLVLEWTDPAFTAGHWVPDMVTFAGGESILGRPGENSQGVEWSTIRDANADVVVVSPCGFRLEGAVELGRQLLAEDYLPPNAAVWAIDADAFMVRPGPRVVEGVEILAQILHPDLFGGPSPSQAISLA